MVFLQTSSRLNHSFVFAAPLSATALYVHASEGVWSLTAFNFFPDAENLTIIAAL